MGRAEVEGLELCEGGGRGEELINVVIIELDT